MFQLSAPTISLPLKPATGCFNNWISAGKALPGSCETSPVTESGLYIFIPGPWSILNAPQKSWFSGEFTHSWDHAMGGFTVYQGDGIKLLPCTVFYRESFGFWGKLLSGWVLGKPSSSKCNAGCVLSLTFQFWGSIRCTPVGFQIAMKFSSLEPSHETWLNRSNLRGTRPLLQTLRWHWGLINLA